MKYALKPETMARKQAQYAEERKARTLDLYKHCIEAAFKNRHNPTGQDYLASAKRIRAELRKN